MLCSRKRSIDDTNINDTNLGTNLGTNICTNDSFRAIKKVKRLSSAKDSIKYNIVVDNLQTSFSINEVNSLIEQALKKQDEYLRKIIENKLNEQFEMLTKFYINYNTFDRDNCSYIN
jgi:hypothetical protein